MLASPFFRRLFLPSFVLIGLVTAAIGLFGAAGLRSSYLERTRTSLNNQSYLTAELLRPLLRPNPLAVPSPLAAPSPVTVPALSPATLARARQILRRAGQQTHARLTVVASDGTVLADTEADPARMDNHGGRPEILAAGANGAGDSIRPSDTLHEDLLYFARRLDVSAADPAADADAPALTPPATTAPEATAPTAMVLAAVGPARATYFVRLAVHLSDLDHQLWALYSGLGTMALASLLGAGLICYYFARHHAAPLVELTAFADALAHGDLNRRLLRPASGEIDTLTRALNSMADSLAAMVAQAAKDKAELLTILASMNEGVIATDLGQRILLVNAAAAKLLQFDAAAAHGKRLWEVVRHNSILQAADAVMASQASQVLPVGPMEGRHLEVTVCTFPSRPSEAPPAPRDFVEAIRPDPHAGEALEYDAASPSPAAAPHNLPAPSQAHGLVVVAHDTTQTVQYQDLRKEFVANVSHELRTPLSIIKGFAETLRDGAMNDRVRGPEYLRIVEKHVDQLTNLVNDLLELSKLESQPGLSRRTAVDLGALVRKVGDLLMPAAERKKQTLLLEVAPHLPPVPGDPDYLERAIGNLVDNAVKYTPEGGTISVTVRAERGGAGGATVILPGGGPRGADARGLARGPASLPCVTVEVRDNGLGIPAADLPRIFERFYRVDRSRSREMGGTGLGLSIVKHVAQSHGGTIEVASHPGAGSVFRLRLPAVAARAGG